MGGSGTCGKLERLQDLRDLVDAGRDRMGRTPDEDQLVRGLGINLELRPAAERLGRFLARYFPEELLGSHHVCR